MMQMEGHDPFEAGAPAVEDDPFAEAERGGVATEPDPAAVPDEKEPLPGEMADVGNGDPQEGSPPIVDREGRKVDPAVADARKATEEAREAAQDYADGAPQPEGVQDDGSPAEPAQAAPEPQEDPPPAEGAKKPEMRRYKLLYQSGPGQWAEAPLDEAPDGSTEVKDGENWLLARNADHARRLAFGIFGRPDDGVTVVPVAASSWKPKRVRRKPPEPAKEKLDIS